MREIKLKLYLLVVFGICLFSTCKVNASILPILLDDNNPPNPPYIEGHSLCKTQQQYLYNFTITDPDGNRLIELFIMFGDGTNITMNYQGSSCHKGWRSGMILDTIHVWKKPNEYTIKAKVKDLLGEWSDWGYLTITVSKSKDIFLPALISKNIFLQFGLFTDPFN